MTGIRGDKLMFTDGKNPSCTFPQASLVNVESVNIPRRQVLPTTGREAKGKQIASIQIRAALVTVVMTNRL